MIKRKVNLNDKRNIKHSLSCSKIEKLSKEFKTSKTEEKNKMELRKQQNIYESYIEICLRLGAELKIPFEITKETLLNAITNRNTKKNHEKMFEKINLELETNSETYQENRKIENIMKELCLL